MPKSFATEGLQKPAPTTPLVHLQVPPGMDAALRGLTREVLRRQPSDLYLFAHRYFESLLAARCAQQAEDEPTDRETLYSSKKQTKHSESSYTHTSSMREYLKDEDSKKEEGSREFIHRIHLEDDSPKTNVVHNINIELEDPDASMGETTVKVEITEDGGKRSEKKRMESRDTASFEEEITRTRTEHVTVCKSWKVETRVETSESGEIRVESYTDAGKSHGKSKQATKPRKFAGEEGKQKSQSLIEEEKKKRQTRRESKSKSFENVDKTASRELIALEKQAAAQKTKMKTDEGKKYQSFVKLDDDEDSTKSQSERLIEIERECEGESDEVLTRSRRDVGDSTREVSPDFASMRQSPEAVLRKMEESLIQLKELEKKEVTETKEEKKEIIVEMKEEMKVSDEKMENDGRDHLGLVSPEDALLQMEKSLIKLKETSFTTDEVKDNVGKTVLEKMDDASSEAEVGRQSSDEKHSVSVQSEDESKIISEEKHRIIENVKEVVHEIEETAATVSSHIHGKTSPGKTESPSAEKDDSSKEKTDVEDPGPDDKESIVVEAATEEILTKEESAIPESDKEAEEESKKGEEEVDESKKRHKRDVEGAEGEEIEGKNEGTGGEKAEAVPSKATGPTKSHEERLPSPKLQEEKDERSESVVDVEQKREERVETPLNERVETSIEEKEAKDDGKGKSIEKEESTLSSDPEKGSQEISDEKHLISIESEDELKISHISDEKHKVIESVKEVVNEIEEKAAGVFRHIHGKSSPEKNEETKVDKGKSTEKEEAKDESAVEENEKSVGEEKSEARSVEVSLEKEEGKEESAEKSLDGDTGIQENVADESVEREETKDEKEDTLKQNESGEDEKEGESEKLELKVLQEELTSDKNDDNDTVHPESRKLDESLEKVEEIIEAQIEKDKPEVADKDSTQISVVKEGANDDDSSKIISKREALEEEKTFNEPSAAEGAVEKETMSSEPGEVSKEGTASSKSSAEDEVSKEDTASASKPGAEENVTSVTKASSKTTTEEEDRSKEDKAPDEQSAEEETPKEGVAHSVSIVQEDISKDTASGKSSPVEEKQEEKTTASERTAEEEVPEVKSASSDTILQGETQDNTAPSEPTDEVTHEVIRVRRSTEEFITKSEELSENKTTIIMTKTIHSSHGPEQEFASEETEIKEHQEERSETKVEEVKKEHVDIEDVFGHKTYPIEDADTLETDEIQEEETVHEEEVQVSAGKDESPQTELSSKENVGVESDEEATAEKESLERQSTEEKPEQKLPSLDEDSSVSEGTGDRFLPPTVVISRVADVVELTDGEAKIVSQMEKEGLTTELDENAKIKAGHWSAEDAHRFLAGESQHTYHSLRKPEMFYSDLQDARPPEKTDQEDQPKETTEGNETKDSDETETPSIEYVVEEQEESPPEKTDSLGQESDSREENVKFSLVEVDENGEEIKNKPWLARAHTVDEIFEKQDASQKIPVSPTPPRRKSVPGQVDVMMEMSKATSRIGQSIMVLSGEEKQRMQRSDSDEYCISEDAIYIPLRPQGAEPEIVEESDDEPFRIDQPPPTFTYDSDEGEWGAALAEHLKKSEPSLTTVIIERKVDDPAALGRVTITEITDEDEKAMTEEKRTSAQEEQPKPVFEIGSPVSDRSTDPADVLRSDKHRPSLADISEENLESVDDTEASTNVELHISLSDGDNLSQRSYGADSERKWTDDLSNVALKAKDAVKSLFSPRKDRQSPAGSESSLTSEPDDGKKIRKRSISKEESKEPNTENKHRSITLEDSLAENQKETSKEKLTEGSSEGSQDSAKQDEKIAEVQKTQTESAIDDKEAGSEEGKTKPEASPKEEDKPSLRSLSSSVSLPLPDASYDVQSASEVATPGGTGTDLKESAEDFEEESSKGPGTEEESHRSKRSVEPEDVEEGPKLKDERVAPGSGPAAGTAVQDVAERAEDKEGTRVSAKDQKEAGVAGHDPVSEPKDSMTSVISETLDSVESLPSEVSKNLWSIDDVPLAENLNEIGVQVDEKLKDDSGKVSETEESEKDAAEEGRDERSRSPEKGVADNLLEKIESQVERTEKIAEDVRQDIKSEVDEVKSLAHKSKEETRHKLERKAEVAQESWEEIKEEGRKIEDEIKEELVEKSEEIKEIVATTTGDVKDIKDNLEKTAEVAEEKMEVTVHKVSEDVKEKVGEVEDKAEETVKEGRSKLGGMIDSVGEKISEVKEQITSVFKEGEHEVKEMEEEASKTVDEISVEVSENLKQAEQETEKEVEKEKSGISKFIGGVAGGIAEVKHKISESVSHVKDEVKSTVSGSENRVEEVAIEVREKAEEAEDNLKEKSNEVECEIEKFVTDVKTGVHEGKEKVEELAERTEHTIEEEVSNKVEKIENKLEEAVQELKDKFEKEEDAKGKDENNGSKVKEEDLGGSLSKSELEEVEKRLEESIEKDKSVDEVDKVKEEDKEESKPKAEKSEEKEELAVTGGTTKMVLDKRKEDRSESEELEAAEVSARSIVIPEKVSAADEKSAKSDSDSSETRRTKRHVLQRGDTLEGTRSSDTIPAESVDESVTSMDRADTVVHVTLDEPESTSEATKIKEEVVVPIHIDLQEASPVPPGKDTKATETDLLEKETVSRGTEPEETTEQMAEALRSEVKDLEERLSRLKESTWSLSQAGADTRKGQGEVNASAKWTPEDVTERTIHVKKSISSAESMSFASRVLSTPMGSVREEYSEMKKSTAETTHETILTVDKGVQSENAADGNTPDSGERKTTVTTATQVSVPSDEPSDKVSKHALFQRAKSMDANTEARAITNFSKRNLKTTKADSSQSEAQQSETADN